MAIVAQVVLAMAIVLVSNLQELLNYLSVTLSLSAAASVACLFVRRRELSIAGRLVLIPAGLYVGSTVFLAALMAIQKPGNLLGTAITFATGILVYFIFVGKRIRGAAG